MILQKYIWEIRVKLSKIHLEDAPWADDDQQVLGQLQLLEMDLEFLCLFCECLDAWDDGDRFRSTAITSIRVVWAENHKGPTILDRLSNTWAVDVHAFLSLAFDLKGKIQQSKPLVEQWCEYLVHYSFKLMQHKFSDSVLIWDCLFIHLNCSCITDKIVPFKNQIDILIDKLVILDRFLEDLKCCTDSKNLLESMNFAGAFAINAACLACLYWAKEADEETATEMNIVLFDMLHKFIANAPHFTILISQNLRPSSDSLVLSATVASLVDFLFDHLDDDDFLILRDPIIRLFTYLANPSHKNAEAEKEEDVLRSQVYALFSEHSYLLQPIGDNGEMKEVFSDKKMLLSDFMTQIEIASAKFRQLYYEGFSNSCISLEAEKMDYVYFVSVSRELYYIEKHVEWADHLVRSQLPLYRMELKSMRVFLLCFATWEDYADEEIMARLSSIITSLQGIWRNEEAENGLLAARFHAMGKGDTTDWHPLASELEEKIQLSKVELEAWCLNSFHWSFQFKPSPSDKTVKFLDSSLDFLNDLVTYKAGDIVPFKKQIDTLEEKLLFLRNFLILTVSCIDSKELGEFKMLVQAFANDAAFLTFLYWAKDANEKIESEVSLMLSHMLHKINPVTSDVARLYFGTLKAIYLQQSDSLLFGQTASIFVDFFIENHLGTPFKDDFQILHDELIFLLTFLNDPPKRNILGHDEVIFLLTFLNDPPKRNILGESICSHIDDLFWEDVYGFLPFDDTEGDFLKKKMILSDFIMKIGTVNAKIRQLYSDFPDSSLFNFPKLISPLFLDFIIQNLRNLKERMISDRKYVPFAKYRIIKIEEELVSLRPFFDYVFDLQSESNEKWLEVVDLIHLTEHVISSCISSWFVFDHPIWYHMAIISDVIDRIKVLKTKLEKIKENTLCNARCLPSTSFITTLSEQAKPSQINEIVVGFEDEAEKIIGMLTQGSMSLDIVSIVGMGGLGKTTIAKKVYGSSSVKCNFDVFAFCSISQDYNTRRLFFDILCDINRDDDRLSEMDGDDLAHQLWKCLTRRKYLIVLDDIWDVSAWNEVKNSFPNDKNGSRVIFTTRSREVADICKINCSPYQLRFMSEVESWELLQRKVFHNGISPPYLFEAGRRIAKNCKGLPLAVAVIAGLLARTEKSLRWWEEVAENLVSYLYDEGCMKILELSYKHLPEILKPCLLYLAAFPEDRLIEVKKVILIWVAEGFVQESKTKSLEDVAKDYFHDLVDRNLIIVSARSSDGGIKRIRVHDLIHDLCQTKCREGKFFQLNHGIASSGSSDSSINNHHRVSMQKKSDVTVAGGSSTLLYFSKQYDERFIDFPFKEFRLAQVLALDFIWQEYDVKQLSSLVHLRHLDARLVMESIYISSSICNIWNIGSLILKQGVVHLPETFWGMKSLRHVEVNNSILKFPDGREHEAYPKLDKVVSFSQPFLSSGKDLRRLLQRLPAVRKLSCYLASDYDEESVGTLDFHTNIESLKLRSSDLERPCFLINKLFPFPSNLKKLTLVSIQLDGTDISALVKLQRLQVLKLKCISLQEPKLEMEDVAFQNLKFFELHSVELVEWNATTESLPCLEQLVIDCPYLEELPPCFEEISNLKRIDVRMCSKVVQRSALRIKEEQMELGNEVEVSV